MEGLHKDMNMARLCGVVMGIAEADYAPGMMCATLDIKRLSGKSDFCPVLVTASVAKGLQPGDGLNVVGEIRSYPIERADGSTGMLLRAWANEAQRIAASRVDNANRIILSGAMDKNPIWRETPFGKEITDTRIRVWRGGEVYDSIPLISWNMVARITARFLFGDPVCVNGRFQSRDYEKRQLDGSVKKRTTYEVSILRIISSQNLAKTGGGYR